MRITKCDRCGKEIDYSDIYKSVGSQLFEIISKQYKYDKEYTQSIDLCFNCSRDFETFLGIDKEK